MKPACLRLTPLLLIGLLSGCAAAIDHYSGRFRNTLAAGETRATIRAELGEPQLCQQAAFLTEDKVQGCDRFTVLGKIHKRHEAFHTVNLVLLASKMLQLLFRESEATM